MIWTAKIFIKHFDSNVKITGFVFITKKFIQAGVSIFFAKMHQIRKKHIHLVKPEGKQAAATNSIFLQDFEALH